MPAGSWRPGTNAAFRQSEPYPERPRLSSADGRPASATTTVLGKYGRSPANQAFNGLLFLFREVLHFDPGNLADTVRAKASHRLPVVFSQEEVGRLFEHLSGTPLLMAQLIC